MKIKWLGQCCFVITSNTGVKIILDPYQVVRGLKWGEITGESADAVTVSHDHFDHNNIQAVVGNPVVITTKTTKVKGIEIRAIHSYHDEKQGQVMGENAIICFAVDGIRLCHLGDLGQTLTAKQLAEIGAVDVLFIPVGGVYTIDASGATKLCERIKPKIIFPMHYRCQWLPTFPGTTVAPFLEGKKVIRLDKSELEFTPETLPTESQVLMLKPAL
jgi:L-ascorbate metabolism protein UlaG (beta-lactamase superfamily)